MVKNLSVMQEMRIQSLGQEDPLEKGMITHSSILAHFMFWIFSGETCGILAPQPGIELLAPALEVKVLTTRSPGKFIW